MSQAGLSEMVGLSPNYVGLIERGLKQPTLETLLRLADALDVEPADLLGRRKPADDWADEVAAVAASIPKQMRPTALAVLRAIAAPK